MSSFYTVCTDYFNKCYILLDDITKLYERSTSTWSFVEYNVCERYNWTLVSLHSKQEQDFVANILLNRFNHTIYKFAYIGKFLQGSMLH